MKAMQCNNIDRPLGQGLWEGVQLRDVLRLAGKIDNARRLFYWGFHNNDPKQMFRSSLAMNQVLDTPPGGLPPFLAYKLNGAPIPLKRGGPVRMLVPWAHGFKSVKWLQMIALTDDYRANDTYAEQNNDPESTLKTAAYLDNLDAETFPAGKPITLRGSCMVGWPGLERVEYWLRPGPARTRNWRTTTQPGKRQSGSPVLSTRPPRTGAAACRTAFYPRMSGASTSRAGPRNGRYGSASRSGRATLKNVKPGSYEFRVRTVDQNGFAQPEPRPYQKSGRNAVQCKLVTVVA